MDLHNPRPSHPALSPPQCYPHCYAHPSAIPTSWLSSSHGSPHPNYLPAPILFPQYGSPHPDAIIPKLSPPNCTPIQNLFPSQCYPSVLSPTHGYLHVSPWLAHIKPTHMNKYVLLRTHIHATINTMATYNLLNPMATYNPCAPLPHVRRDSSRETTQSRAAAEMHALRGASAHPHVMRCGNSALGQWQRLR